MNARVVYTKYNEKFTRQVMQYFALYIPRDGEFQLCFENDGCKMYVQLYMFVEATERK